MNEMVSVIIPTYNRAHRLRQAIDSVLNQTYKNIEIIIVNDGSSDNTLEVLSNYNHKNIKVISFSRKHGAQKARNEGIKHSCGKWICFLDSDDYWGIERISRAIHVANKFPNSVICCDGYLVEEVTGYKKRLQVIKNFQDIKSEILSQPGVMFQGLLIKKSHLEAIGFLDEDTPAHQDWDLAISLVRNFPFEYIDEPHFYYVKHREACITQDKILRAKGYRYVSEKHELFL